MARSDPSFVVQPDPSLGLRLFGVDALDLVGPAVVHMGLVVMVSGLSFAMQRGSVMSHESTFLKGFHLRLPKNTLFPGTTDAKPIRWFGSLNKNIPAPNGKLGKGGRPGVRPALFNVACDVVCRFLPFSPCSCGPFSSTVTFKPLLPVKGQETKQREA